MSQLKMKPTHVFASLAPRVLPNGEEICDNQKRKVEVKICVIILSIINTLMLVLFLDKTFNFIQLVYNSVNDFFVHQVPNH